MKKKLLLLVVMVLLAVLALMPVSAQGKSIIINWNQEPETLNTFYTPMTFAGYTAQMIVAPAWDFDGEGNPQPVLVKEMPSADNGGISADGLVFTLKLREGMKWSDGDPLDSADFKFTYEMAIAEGNTIGGRNPYDKMSSVETPDATTVVVTFAEPYAPWLGMFRYVLPEHVLRPVFEAEGTIDNADYNQTGSVSSGPFVLEEWNRGNFMRFSANPNFVLGVVPIDTVIVTFVEDDEAIATNLKNGDLQVATFLPFSYVPELQAAGLEVQIVPSGYNEGLYLNVGPTAHPAMQDVRVRRALALGLDREAIVRDLLEGATFVPASWWENTPYASPNVTVPPYDPEAAAALLDEAGWVDSNNNGIRDKDGVELVLRYITNMRGIRREIQAIAQQQYAQIGIGIELNNFPSAEFFAPYKDGGPQATGQYEITEFSGSPGTFPDPHTTRFLCDQIPTPEKPEGSNYQGYCNPEVDKLMAAQLVETDFNARVALWHQIDELLTADAVWIGIWHDADVWVVGKGLNTGGLISGVTPFSNVVNWSVE